MNKKTRFCSLFPDIDANFGSFGNVIKSISEVKENQILGKTSKKFIRH